MYRVRFEDTPRTRGLALAAVALCAVLLRVAYVAEVHDHPYFTTPLVDAADFHGRALEVMRGEGLGAQVYYKAPAYGWLLGHWFRLTSPSLWLAYALQMAGGVTTAVLIAALGMRWFGVASGLIAGLLTAISASLPYFENQLLIESAALSVSVASVFLWARRGQKWRVASDVLAGALAGVALQLRPVNVALVAALALWLGREPGGVPARVRRLAALCIPVLLALAPTLRHNYFASGRVVPISVNGGINFYIGNNPDYDTTVAIRPGLRWEQLTARFGSMSDPVRWQQNFYQASFEYMRQHPVAYLRLLGKKLLLFWYARDIDRNQDSSSMLEESRVLRWAALPWAPVAVLGLAGLVACGRVLRGTPVGLLIVVQMLGVLAFFVTSRYRTAVLPWMALAAAVALVEAGRVVRGRKRRSGLQLAIGFIVALAVVVPDWTGAGQHDFGRPDFEMAEVLARRGDRDGAMAAYERAAARHPNDPDVRLRYGEHLERFGRFDTARAEYERAAALAPWSYKPLLAAGGIALQEGDLDGAESLLSDAERRGDPTGRSLYDLGLVEERRRNWDRARELYTQSAARPDVPRERLLRHLGMARTLYLSGQRVDAERAFAALVPEDSILVHVEWAEATLRAGDAARALDLLQPWSAYAADARAAFVQARALLALGRESEAREAAQRAVERAPREPRYRDWLEALDAR